jgi:hypothetical protein
LSHAFMRTMAEEIFHVYRFHPLPEFDEGKRSCRRRLEGHNRRRRKTQPDPTARSYLMGDDDLIGRGGAGLVSGLLHILAQLQGKNLELFSLDCRTNFYCIFLAPS